MAKKTKKTKPKISYKVGDAVLAKVRGYPIWPGKVSNIKGPGRWEVTFFHTKETATALKEIKLYDPAIKVDFKEMSATLIAAYKECHEYHEKFVKTSSCKDSPESSPEHLEIDNTQEILVAKEELHDSPSEDSPLQDPNRQDSPQQESPVQVSSQEASPQMDSSQVDSLKLQLLETKSFQQKSPLDERPKEESSKAGLPKSVEMQHEGLPELRSPKESATPQETSEHDSPQTVVTSPSDTDLAVQKIKNEEVCQMPDSADGEVSDQLIRRRRSRISQHSEARAQRSKSSCVKRDEEDAIPPVKRRRSLKKQFAKVEATLPDSTSELTNGVEISDRLQARKSEEIVPVDCSLIDLTSEQANAERAIKKLSSLPKELPRTNNVKTIEKLKRKLQKKLDEKEGKKKNRREKKEFEKASNLLPKFTTKIDVLVTSGAKFIADPNESRNATQLRMSIRNCEKCLDLLSRCVIALSSEYGRTQKESKKFQVSLTNMVLCLKEIRAAGIKPSFKEAKQLLSALKERDPIKEFINKYDASIETKELIVERKENAQKRMKLSR